jgi:hypothetical protein
MKLIAYRKASDTLGALREKDSAQHPRFPEFNVAMFYYRL